MNISYLQSSLCSSEGCSNLDGEGGELLRSTGFSVASAETNTQDWTLAYLLAGVENTPRMMSLPCILMMGLVECSRLK